MSKRIKVAIVAALVSTAALGVVVGRHSVPVTTHSTSTTIGAIPHRMAQPVSAIWPFAATVNRFDSPVLAAQAFTTAYLGIANPIMGVYRRGDGRSGEIEVRATPRGAATTILVRKLATTDSWWVLGASCPDITVVSPSSSETISSPVVLKGRSTAFEAVVNVDIRQDGSLTSLQRARATGGSMGVLRPFRKSITFQRPTAPRGAVLLRTISAKDGHVIEAAVIRVTFSR
jgi:hypothetical protein